MEKPIATKPVFWKRICYRICFGKDIECDNCKGRLWWKGNRIIAGNTEVFLCNKCEYEIFPLFSQGTQEKSKSPSPCRHTLEDGADATTELVSGKSSGFIGGMR